MDSNISGTLIGWFPEMIPYNRIVQHNKTKMILRQIGSNQTEISFNNGTTLFFSYETPVAGHTILDGYFKTDTYYSRTTSKHINQYLKHADSYVKTVTNDYIVSLCHPEGLWA